MDTTMHAAELMSHSDTNLPDSDVMAIAKMFSLHSNKYLDTAITGLFNYDYLE